jgi:hypothetical protein
MAYSLGIDLGTTYSAAAIARGDRLEIFQLGERAATIPSIVLLRDDGEVLTGEAAERRALAEPTRTGREFKRRLGDPTPIILGGTPYGAEALLAHLLRSIVARVSEQSGEPPAAIALCHPASYGAYKLDLFQQAIRQADIGPVELLTEPEAAALYYARQERVPAGTVIAVYDFGGGTFDATILRKTEDGFEALGQPEGLERLGGIDFDEALFRRVMGLVAAQGVQVDANDPSTLAALARLREECRRAKEALSSDTDATIPIFLPGIQTELRLTRSEFEESIRPRIRETIEALGRATRSAGLGFEDVDRVLLVGGSSRIPLVAEMVREATGRPVAVDAHPKHTMALGAAFVAESHRQPTGAVPAAIVPAAALPSAEAAPAETLAEAVPPAIDETDTALPVPLAAETTAASPPSDGIRISAGTAGRGMMPLALGAVAVVLVAAIALGASGILGGGASASPSNLAIATTAPSVATASPSLLPTPSATPIPTPVPTPTPTPTPAGRQARILGITSSGGRYVVDYAVYNYKQVLPGRHVHFFFDTVKPAQAGVPGKGPWILYAGPIPFKGYKVSDRPSAATKMCILVANMDHSVIQGTGNCMTLPA